MAKIEVENLYKIFGPHPKRTLEMVKKGASKAEVMEKYKHGVGVNNASFQVEEGEIVVVMGLSGSGKSTLVRCINRLIEPTDGSVRIDGQDVTKLDPKALRELRLSKLGMVFQNFALFPHRSVADNAAYGLEIKGVDLQTRRKKAQEALELVGLGGWEDSSPGQLSGGMQQRVGLARALALDADILLMDEAFSALDPLIRSDMQGRADQSPGTHEEDHPLHQPRPGRGHQARRPHRAHEGRGPSCRSARPRTSSPIRPTTTWPGSWKTWTSPRCSPRTASMKKAKALGYIDTDGPRASLRKMKKEGISSLFVINKGHRLQGIIYAEDASEAAGRGEKDIKSILKADIETVRADTPAMDLINLLHDLPYPLAVVDDENRILGVINRGALLGRHR